MLSAKRIGRREFLGSLGGGLLVLCSLGEDLNAQESGGARRREAGHELPEDVAAWLHIAPNGEITAFTGKVEVGQNVRTSLTQAVADELRCSPSMVRLVMGDTALTPWDMGTFGSRTTPTMAPVMRKMAGTARQQLLTAAAQKWSADPKSLEVKNACVINSAIKKSASFGELAGSIDWVHVVGDSGYVTAPSNWQVAGQSVPKVNAREIVMGKHKYASDQKRAGLVYGAVLRPPSFGATLTSLNTAAASAISGVKVVHDGDFVGVTAPNEQIASQALAAIHATWQEKPQISSAELFTYIKPNGPSPAVTANGNPAKTLNARYTIAYIAHVPLEPRAAVAEWTEDKLTVWTGTQRPFGVRSELASEFKIPENQVHVIMPDTGSAYGGKHTGECAIEAARLAKAVGKPVKLVWTREEEFTWAYLRPAGVIEIDSGIGGDGALMAWEFHNYMSGPSGLPTPYEVPVKKEQFHQVESPLREGSYRGLAATANHFARESHMDDLAALAGMNPLAFRLRNLQNPRLKAVLIAATDKFGWSKVKSSKNTAFGLACGTEKGGYVAACAQITIDKNRDVHVDRVVEAWECGAIVNPEHLKNQVEGAIVMGLGGALFEAIDFANGRILNPHLAQYRVPRFSDAPKIEVILLDRKDTPSAGAGETPIVCIAPAIGNAIFAATGLRIRSMPILPTFRA
ncbi:MAG TPA: molybdopterin cofactor-binding domain-containing protein [Bryobacteraceae bacterium]|nr:molybdopterin cofactor-binding domain-containing protein [Bryobacteraceae bacterium]